MQNARENINQPLNYTEYDISGNVFRAYYDADGKMVFVLDFTESAVKPNVLLVINPVGNRKWDDILMNDYGVDLETVRPKKDNKYQKLDIEYTGLAEYDELINTYKSGADLSVAVQNLSRFHDEAARRAAYERLGAAEVQANNARETIEKTKTTISELQSRLKVLRNKLLSQRREIGREPTKQSAAKILRTETQIDAANDKLARAKKRLQKAQRRLANAEEEIDVTNKILAILEEKIADVDNMMLPVKPVPSDVITFNPVFDDEKAKEEIYTEPKAEDMADEEVKPLFDTDPKILNDEIAFKPVNFGAPAVVAEEELPAVVEDELLPMPMPEPQLPAQAVDFAPVVDVPTQVPDVVEADNDVVPLSFVPPVASEEVVFEPESEAVAQPVLETITSVSEPASKIDSELLPEIDVPDFLDEQSGAPVANVSQHVLPEQEQPQIQSMSEFEPAPVETSMRPVSPIAGQESENAAVPISTDRQKPTALYYFLLMVLIVLSIFTLWFYQKSANKSLPVLGAETVQAVVIEESAVASAPVEDATEDAEQPVQEAVETEQEILVENAPVVEAVSVDVAPQPVPVVEPEPVQVAPVVDLQLVPIVELIDAAIAESDVPEPIIAPVQTESPFLESEEKTKSKVLTEEEILATKPVYGVSQNEKMFVAADDYQSDAADVVDGQENVMLNNVYEEMANTQIIRPELQVVNEILPDAEYQLATQEVFAETETVDTCADGAAPDMNGCCSGEELRELDDEYMCCAIGTDDCFPPMI